MRIHEWYASKVADRNSRLHVKSYSVYYPVTLSTEANNFGLWDSYSRASLISRGCKHLILEVLCYAAHTNSIVYQVLERDPGC